MVKSVNHYPPRPSVSFCFVPTRPCYCIWPVQCTQRACLGRFQSNSLPLGVTRWPSKCLDRPHPIWRSQEPCGPEGDAAAQNSPLHIHVLPVHRPGAQQGRHQHRERMACLRVSQLPGMSLFWKQFFQLQDGNRSHKTLQPETMQPNNKSVDLRPEDNRHFWPRWRKSLRSQTTSFPGTMPISFHQRCSCLLHSAFSSAH